MSKLPDGKVPQLDSKGARYWLKQRVYQIPLQDFSTEHCRKLALDQKMAMDDMCLKRTEKALGVGNKFYYLLTNLFKKLEATEIWRFVNNCSQLFRD